MAAAKTPASRELFSPDAQDTTKATQLALRSELLQGSSLFPQRLLRLNDAPQKLFAVGSISALTCPAIAIVGARKATAYGLECAKRFARIAAKRGIAVVSGGAIGCDLAAHRGALDAGGITLVVLGSGADVVYPLRARSLFEEVIQSQGLLLSEAPWGSAPIGWAFSKRNRIIAALAEATLIVEAGLPSGTFQTADHTLALGNDVLVVPGPIFSKESRGSNRLLTQGATPVIDEESFNDTLDILFGPTIGTTIGSPVCHGAINSQERLKGEESTSGRAPQEIKEQRLVEHVIADLSAHPMTIDALAQARNVSIVELIHSLTKLEIAGQVERLRDGRYSAKSNA